MKIEQSEPIATCMGREIEKQLEFKVNGTFESMYAANKWLRENGFGYGSADAMNPTAISLGDYYKENNLPHKWHNFDEEDKLKIAGIMTGDTRNGPVKVILFKNQDH